MVGSRSHIWKEVGLGFLPHLTQKWNPVPSDPALLWLSRRREHKIPHRIDQKGPDPTQTHTRFQDEFCSKILVSAVA